ncbi:MAG: hypothetical protein WCY88_02825 [Spongiibacteraceae bacterium]|jgi:hydrogenase/urease accessory protein HupE
MLNKVKQILAGSLVVVSSSAIAHDGHHDSNVFTWFTHLLTHNDHLFAWFGIAGLLMAAAAVWGFIRTHKPVDSVTTSTKLSNK